MKSLKEHLIKLCVHEHGHVLILAIINSMDDTKALKKAVFDIIFSQIEYIASNEWGKKVRSFNRQAKTFIEISVVSCVV